MEDTDGIDFRTLTRRTKTELSASTMINSLDDGAVYVIGQCLGDRLHRVIKNIARSWWVCSLTLSVAAIALHTSDDVTEQGFLHEQESWLCSLHGSGPVSRLSVVYSQHFKWSPLARVS